MARTAAVRDMYGSDKVTTTPERLITMLYDRLVRDLLAAEGAIERQDVATAHDELVHAQEIVFELLSALDVDKWSGGPRLSALYTWILQQLYEANLHKDVARVQHCRSLIEPLCEAWHQAAAVVTHQNIQPVATGTRSMGAAV